MVGPGYRLRFFRVAFFAVLRVDRFLAALRFAGLRADFFFVARLLVPARFFVVRFFVPARFFVVRLFVARFFVVRLAALRFAGLRAAFFLRAGAFFLAGLRANFFLAVAFFFLAVAFFLLTAFFTFASFSLGAAGARDGSHGRGSGGVGGGGGGHVLPEPPPWSPLSPPPLGGHVGVMVANPPSANADRAVAKVFPRTLRGSRRKFQCPRVPNAGTDAKRPRRSGVVEHRARLGRTVDQENDWPHPHVRVVFGLLMVNPAPCSPSL
jgi:hypothetical protein